jgi:hypothetical protein
LGEVFREHVLGIGVYREGKGNNPILFEKKSSVFGVIPANAWWVRLPIS